MGRVVIQDGLGRLRKPSSVGFGTGGFGGASTGAAPSFGFGALATGGFGARETRGAAADSTEHAVTEARETRGLKFGGGSECEAGVDAAAPETAAPDSATPFPAPSGGYSFGAKPVDSGASSSVF